MLFTPQERRLLLLLILLLSAGFCLSGLRELGLLPRPRGAPTGAAPASAFPPAASPRTEAGAGWPCAPESAGAYVGGFLDLNRADSLQLLALPGIGPALGGRILALRRRRGGFARLEELREVPGIGEKRLAALRDYLVVP
jgi:competence protein ComEA